MKVLSNIWELFGFRTSRDAADEAESEAFDEGPLIAHRRPDGTVIRYEASESLLKAAALAAGRVPPPDLSKFR